MVLFGLKSHGRPLFLVPRLVWSASGLARSHTVAPIDGRFGARGSRFERRFQNRYSVSFASAVRASGTLKPRPLVQRRLAFVF